MLEGFGIQAQEKLKSSSVLVVGAGGLGCPILQYLTSAGVGRIGVIDDDYVELSNLQRQFLYDTKDVGQPKVQVAAKRLSEHNPYVDVQPFFERLTAGNIKDIFSKFDIVIDGSDNFETRYLINDACVLLNKTLIYGAIFKFSGQVSVFNYNNGPTYRCLFPEPPGQDALPSCAEIGVLGVLPGIVGSIQALEAIKVMTGVGETLSGKVLLYDGLNQQFSKIALELEEQNLEISELVSISENIPCRVTPQKMNKHFINEISPQDLIEIFKQNSNTNIIDVRESWEREIDLISPSVHIPLGNFSGESVTELLPSDLSAEITVYCKAGVRSLQACNVLSQLGYRKVNNLSGGMINWQAENLPEKLV